MNPWHLSYRSSPRAVRLADRHYSRRASSVGHPNIAPPGEPLVLLTADGAALWRRVGATRGGLEVLRLSPCPQPQASAPVGSQGVLALR